MEGPPSTATSVYPVNPAGLPAGVLREGRYEARFATSDEELDAILRLRFEIFNLELGEGLAESRATGRDRDDFDAGCHHLMVAEVASGQVVGTYRVQTAEMAASHLGFYSATEFDLAGLPAAVTAGAVEIGRACIARPHRSTQVLFLLWKGLARYVAANRKRYLFGCCSLTGQDFAAARAVAAHLERAGHVHPEIRVAPLASHACPDGAAAGDPAAPPALPMLFRIYLRHGGKVCSAPAVDRHFNTIDFLVLFDVDGMSRRLFQTYFG